MTTRLRRGAAATSALAFLLAGCGTAAGPATEVVLIPSGATVRAVADSLAVHGVIGSRLWFRVLTRLTGKQHKLQSGSYALHRGGGGIAALKALASGRALLTRLTIPEGFTLLDIAAATERQLQIPRDSLLAAARDSALLREFGVPAGSFEGFLDPDTYLFARGTTARSVVRAMASRFRSEWDSVWDRLATAQGLDRLSVVVLGSIVEAEARADSDRALIAAVLRNRLRIGMPLQADATIQYAIELKTGARKPRLYEKDYALPSPYNTYLHPGLPPGPVGAPGSKSLQAVLQPAPVPYLYYVAGPDGRHIFSRSYPEHLRAVRRVRGRP